MPKAAFQPLGLFNKPSRPSSAMAMKYYTAGNWFCAFFKIVLNLHVLLLILSLDVYSPQEVKSVGKNK